MRGFFMVVADFMQTHPTLILMLFEAVRIHECEGCALSPPRNVPIRLLAYALLSATDDYTDEKVCADCL